MRILFFAILTSFIALISPVNAQSIPDASNVKLDGPLRHADFSSDLGRFSVRWQRAAEDCFGTSPSRAVADAASTVNRALSSAHFSSRIKAREWSIVFTDEAAAQSQFPSSISRGRHPGFMIPPNNIYIITQYVTGDCNKGGSGADAELARVLLHEMGHVMEFLILGDSFGGDAERAEGFASWFEEYSSNYSSLISHGAIHAQQVSLAQSLLPNIAPFSGRFSGTAGEYAIAALVFKAYVKKRGVSGLMEIYDDMISRGVSFTDALAKAGWDQQQVVKGVNSAAS